MAGEGGSGGHGKAFGADDGWGDDELRENVVTEYLVFNQFNKVLVF